MAKISERQTVFLLALHKVFGSTEITTKSVNARLAGLRLKEPGHSELLQAIVGCVGRVVNNPKVGKLLQKVVGKRLGDLELIADRETKVGGFWRYWIKDHAAPVLPALDLGQILRDIDDKGAAVVDKIMSLPPSKQGAALDAALNRQERAERDARAAADMAKIKADPELAAAYKDCVKHVKPNRDGQQVEVEELPAPKTATPKTILVPGPTLMDSRGIIRPGGFIEVPAPTPAQLHPRHSIGQLPQWVRRTAGGGFKSRQPTVAELAARHVQSEGSGFEDRGSTDWFIRACEARNRR
jgi:hypothetical protein